MSLRLSLHPHPCLRVSSRSNIATPHATQSRGRARARTEVPYHAVRDAGAVHAYVSELGVRVVPSFHQASEVERRGDGGGGMVGLGVGDVPAKQERMQGRAEPDDKPENRVAISMYELPPPAYGAIDFSASRVGGGGTGARNKDSQGQHRGERARTVS
jgi:hypothetical protein